MTIHELGSRRNRLRAIDDGQTTNLELPSPVTGVLSLLLNVGETRLTAVVELKAAGGFVPSRRMDGLISIGLAAEEVANIPLVQRLALSSMQIYSIIQSCDTKVSLTWFFDFPILMQG